MELENYTAEQRAYHLHEMKTRYARLNVNKDANNTLNDYELTAIRVVQYGKLPKDKADKVLEVFREMAVLIGYGKPGDKISVEEAI